jgi:hypothetical protein
VGQTAFYLPTQRTPCCLGYPPPAPAVFSLFLSSFVRQVFQDVEEFPSQFSPFLGVRIVNIVVDVIKDFVKWFYFFPGQHSQIMRRVFPILEKFDNAVQSLSSPGYFAVISHIDLIRAGISFDPRKTVPILHPPFHHQLQNMRRIPELDWARKNNLT